MGTETKSAPGAPENSSSPFPIFEQTYADLGRPILRSTGREVRFVLNQIVPGLALPRYGTDEMHDKLMMVRQSGTQVRLDAPADKP